MEPLEAVIWMKVGSVRLGEEGLVPFVAIEIDGGKEEDCAEIEALLASGFSGAVSVPLSVVEQLKLKWSGEHSVTLADASEVWVDLYEGIVLFAGRRYRCAVLATGASPAIGMQLMQGMKVCFEAFEGGVVEIERSDD